MAFAIHALAHDIAMRPSVPPEDLEFCKRAHDLVAALAVHWYLGVDCGTGVTSSGVPPQSHSGGGRRSPQGSRDDDVIFPVTRVE